MVSGIVAGADALVVLSSIHILLLATVIVMMERSITMPVAPEPPKPCATPHDKLLTVWECGD
jgi:hypothetical protein